jgi:hypothetical protein
MTSKDCPCKIEKTKISGYFWVKIWIHFPILYVNIGPFEVFERFVINFDSAVYIITVCCLIGCKVGCMDFKSWHE